MGTKITAFEDRSGNFIFVKVPGEYGRYVRTNMSVALTACPACKSEIGEPCHGQYDRYTGSTHADRLVAARRLLAEMMPGKSGGYAGVGRAIAEEDDEPPLGKHDVIGDEEPGIIGQTKVVDLREFFK